MEFPTVISFMNTNASYQADEGGKYSLLPFQFETYSKTTLHFTFKCNWVVQRKRAYRQEAGQA